MGLLAGGAALIGARGLFLLINNSSRFHEKTLVLGNGPLAHLLRVQIQQRPELGMTIVEACAAERDEGGTEASAMTPDRLSDLHPLVESPRGRRILLATNDRTAT